MYRSRSPIAGVRNSNIPLLIAYAEYDVLALQAQSEALIHHVFQARRTIPAVAQAASHNHGSIADHFNSKDRLLGDAILRFMEPT